MHTNNVPSLEWIEQMLDPGDLDGADAALSKLEKVIKAAQPAAADEQDELDDCDGEEDDCEDGEEDDGVQKELLEGRRVPAGPELPAGQRRLGVTGNDWPANDTRALGLDQGHRPIPTPRVHGTPQTRAIRTPTPNVQQPLRHVFDDEVDRIKQRDGSSRMAAMTIARLENPALCTAYQQFHAMGRTASQQAMARGHTNDVNKAGPTEPQTHEEVIDNLIGKGHSVTVANQIAAHQFGNTLPHQNDDTAKVADSVVCKFMRQVDQTMIDESCDRNTAMRKVREQEPDLYEAFQLV